MKHLVKAIKKTVSILLSLLTVFSLFTIAPFEASAAETVSYIYRWWDDDAGELKYETRICTDYIRLNERASNDLEAGKWYVVDSDMTIGKRLTISCGTVNLILCNGKTLTLGSGITVAESAAINIFGQDGDSGKIYAHLDDDDDNILDCAAIIGGDEDHPDTGDISIYGGSLDMEMPSSNPWYDTKRTFDSEGACIGGGSGGSPRSVKIYGGSIKCRSAGDGAAAIGGGEEGNPSHGDGIIIYGGNIESRVDANVDGTGAAIGGGNDADDGAGYIAIYGGEIYAEAQDGAAIGSGEDTDGPPIDIFGGNITAIAHTNSLNSGAGIGSGENGDAAEINIIHANVTAISTDGAGIGSGNDGDAGAINIKNSNIIARSLAGGAGIGGGEEGDGGRITIEDSNVIVDSKNHKDAQDWVDNLRIAANGFSIKMGSVPGSIESIYSHAILTLAAEFTDLLSSSSSGAAIGGGNGTIFGDGGDVSFIKIIHSNVAAMCGNYSAAIGSGEHGDIHNIEIIDSDIQAHSGDYGAAIGSGFEPAPFAVGDEDMHITIQNSKVRATCGTDAAAIGGGDTGRGGVILIENSDIYAKSEGYGAGIGGGDDRNHQGITIKDSYVEAYSGDYGAAIGSGERGRMGDPGSIEIISSTVTAHAGAEGAGIGGGNESDGDVTITITDSDIDAVGGDFAAGIGGGDAVSVDTITIRNSTVRAVGGKDASGIGGGEDGDGGHIEIHDSDVYAEGKHFGAGIGGGEDGDGEYCGIYGNSHVEAVAGSDGWGISIGYGDYPWGASYSTGDLSLSSNLKVKAGNSVYTGDARFRAVWDNKHVYVTDCEHGSVSVCPLDKDNHANYCDQCGIRVGSYSGAHSWDESGICTECGASRSTFKIKFSEKKSNGALCEYTSSDLTKRGYIIPQNQYTPDNTRFVCWVADNGVVYLPGERYSSAVGTTLTAKYLSLVDTTYIDKNGSEATVKAMRISDTDIGLSTGWYVIDSDLDAIATKSIKIKGDVNLIIGDGKNLTVRANGVSAFTGVSSDTVFNLYGQTNQSGLLDIKSVKAEFANFNQYGARLRLVQANNNALEIGQRYDLVRGHIDVPKLIVPQVRFSGGAAVIGTLEVSGEAELSWTDFDRDYYQFGSINCENAAFTIADGQYFKDKRDNVYSGALTSDDIGTLNMQKPDIVLRPYTPHTYGDPEWIWSEDHREATAVFRCTDADCDDAQKVDAKVEVTVSERITNCYATCRFRNIMYTKSVDVNNLWKTEIFISGQGTVTADKAEAEYGEPVTLTAAPAEGYVLKSLTVTDAYDNSVRLTDNQFLMPGYGAKVRAEFVDYEHISAKEPRVSKSGEYILGNVEHYMDDDGVCYAANEDGSLNANTILDPDRIALSYFRFKLLSDDTYMIERYTGPTEISELKIPKTYNGKAVTVLGTRGEALFSSDTPALTLILNENITEIGAYAFSDLCVRQVTGDTSGLKKIGICAFRAREGVDYTIDMTLDYPGVISVERGLFRSSKVLIHAKHVTKLSDDDTGAASLTYDLTDDHLCGDPVWNWAQDLSTAQAVFICSDTRCDRQELVDATVTVQENGSLTTYTATAEFEGKTYTDIRVNDSSYFKININHSEHGSVKADKLFAQKDETVELTAVPEDGYVLERFIVKDADENEITLTGSSFTMPMNSVTVSAIFKAGREVEYLDESGNIKTVKAIALNSSETAPTGGWYYVDGDVTVQNELALSDDVKLILCDGAVLTVSGDITSSGELTVYRAPGESEGKLTASGIRPTKATIVGGQVTVSIVNADVLSVKGGVLDADKLTVQTALKISGGEVDVDANSAAVVCNGDILITGGSVSATTATGDAIVSYGDMTILSGTVTTIGKVRGGGNESAVKIGGGKVTVDLPSGTSANAIISETLRICGGKVTINGGVFTRTDEGYTIGWTHPDDSFYFEWIERSYIAVEDGQSLTDGTNVFSGVYTGLDAVKLLEDVVLTPCGGTAWQAMQLRIDHASNGDTIMMNADVAATEEDTALSIPSGKRITLDLNGFTLDRNLDSAAANGNAIVNNGTLTISDSGGSGNGTITGGFSNTEGGAIINNGTLTLNGGNITGNVATSGGGGIFNKGILTITGGTICDNAVTGGGKNGGGIWTDNSLTISGGSITGNSSRTGNGGGISYNNGSMTVSGAPVIMENTASGSANDLHIWNNDDPDNKVTINGALTENARIGIHSAVINASPFTTGLSGMGAAENFVSNHSDYMIRLDPDGEAVFRQPHTVTVGEAEHGSVEAPAETACEGDTVTLTVTSDEGYSVSSVTVNGVEITPQDGVYRFVMPNEAVTVSAAFGFADGIGARLIGHSLSLDGDIGVNFYMELSDAVAHSDTATMHFTIPQNGKSDTQDIKVSDARKVKSGDKTYYVFKCQVAAKEMTSEIKAQIIDGEKQGTEYTYSVKEYADYLLAHTGERADLAKAAPLVKALLNYSAYTQIYFDRNPGKLANADLTEAEKELGEVSIDAADPVINLPEGVSFAGATLSLKSETTLSLYFKSASALSFSCDGYTVETVKSGGYQIARIRGIKAKHIGSTFSLNVNGATVKYSPLNYCKNALSGGTDDVNLLNAVKALYLYWQAADGYFD